MSIALTVQAQPACDILRVNQLAPNEIELVLGCDVDEQSFAARTFTVTGDGQTIPAVIIERTRRTAGAFAGLRLLLATPMTPDVKYTLHIEKITANNVRIKDKTKEVTGTGTIITNRFLPAQILVTFPTPVTKEVSVTIMRAGQALPVTATRAEQRVPTSLVLELSTPLHDADKLSVTARAINGQRVTASMDKVAFPKPSDRKTAAFYVALTTEAGENQKPNIALDCKAERRRPLSSWTQAPKLDMVVATQDQNGTNNAALGWNIEFHFFTTGTLLGLVYDITPTVEFAKGLLNRDAIIDGTIGFVLPTTRHFTFRPSVGIEAGKNFGLKKDYRQFKDYQIRRLKANAYAAWSWDFTPQIRPSIQRITLSIDATGRHLLHDEINSTPIPPRQQTKTSGKATYTLDDRPKYYVVTSIDAKLADYFGIAVQYTRGEQPLLYENNNKVTLKFTYMF